MYSHGTDLFLRDLAFPRGKARWHINQYSTLARKLPGLFCFSQPLWNFPTWCWCWAKCSFPVLSRELLAGWYGPAAQLSAWIYGDPNSLVRQSFLLMGSALTWRRWRVYNMGLSHSFPFPVLCDLPCFQRRKGGAGESSSNSHWVCSGSCWSVLVALTELLSARSVFPDKGRSWAFGKLSLLGGTWGTLRELLKSVRLLCLRTSKICEGVPPCCPSELDLFAGCPCFSSCFFFVYWTPWCSKIPSLLQISALNAILDWAATDLPHWPHRAFSNFQ